MRYSCAMTQPAQNQARQIVVVEDEPAIAQNLREERTQQAKRASHGGSMRP